MAIKLAFGRLFDMLKPRLNAYHHKSTQERSAVGLAVICSVSILTSH